MSGETTSVSASPSTSAARPRTSSSTTSVRCAGDLPANRSRRARPAASSSIVAVTRGASAYPGRSRSRAPERAASVPRANRSADTSTTTAVGSFSTTSWRSARTARSGSIAPMPARWELSDADAVPAIPAPRQAPQAIAVAALPFARRRSARASSIALAAA